MVTISKDLYLKTSQLFYWATVEHYTMWFTGENKRHGRSEVMLKRLSDKGKLKAYQPKKFGRIYYACLRVKNTDVDHGLGCTEGLVRFWRSDMTGTIISSRFFRGLGSVPEWGIKYANGSLLLYEFCTADNFRRVLKTKIIKYQSNLSQIEERFSGKAVVVFVCDVSAERIQSLLSRMDSNGQLFFVDYTTFKQVEIGHQLSSPIYFWEDGKTYPLRHD